MIRDSNPDIYDLAWSMVWNGKLNDPLLLFIYLIDALR